MTTVTLYVRLLDEGTDCARPTQAEETADGFFRLLPAAGYDPEDEHWEFPPGSVVRAEMRRCGGEATLLAVERLTPQPVPDGLGS